MTTHPTTRTDRPVTQRAASHHTGHTVTGSATQLRTLIATHRDAGTLAAITTPHRVAPGTYQMAIRLRDTQPTAYPTVQPAPISNTRARALRTRRTRIAVIVTTIAGTLAGLITAAAYLIGQLVELITTHAGQILGVLALAAILAALSARGSGHRRHCPGC